VSSHPTKVRFPLGTNLVSHRGFIPRRRTSLRWLSGLRLPPTIMCICIFKYLSLRKKRGVVELTYMVHLLTAVGSCEEHEEGEGGCVADKHYAAECATQPGGGGGEEMKERARRPLSPPLTTLAHVGWSTSDATTGSPCTWCPRPGWGQSAAAAASACASSRFHSSPTRRPLRGARGQHGGGEVRRQAMGAGAGRHVL
jgi:hypothetical protein